jgi:hypothetical protein
MSLLKYFYYSNSECEIERAGFLSCHEFDMYWNRT